MRKTAGLWLTILVLTVLASGGLAEAAFEVYPLAAVRPGLLGTGKSCFHGSELTEFGVEVLGVLGNVIPGRSVVIVRITGPVIEKTGVFSGMSGSPVYIDGKLLGALAYAFPFSREPIAGVTPFEEMKAIFESVSPGTDQRTSAEIVPPTTHNLLELFDRGLGLGDAPAGTAASSPTAASTQDGALKPIATPLALSGLSPTVQRRFQDRLAALGFTPMAGGAPASSIGSGAGVPAIVPGSSVVLNMIQGDIAVGAGGTVTEVDGKTVYAFGHPYLSSGSTEFALNASEVVTVVPSLNNSFKFFTTGAPVGVIRQDRAVGVQGVLGEFPRLLPVDLTIHTSRGKQLKYRFETARDRQLTPLLINMGLANFLTTEERSLGYETIDLTADIALKGGQVIHLRNIFSQANLAPALAAAYVAVPLQYLLLYGFKEIDIEKVSVTARIKETMSVARLEDVVLPKTRLRPGESARLSVTLAFPDGTTTKEDISVPIPDDAPPGPVNVYVGDGTTLTQLDQQLEPGLFLVSSADQLVRVLKQFRQDGTLYVKMFRKADGLFAKGRDYPALPPSTAEIFKGARVQGTTSPVRYLHFYEQSQGDRPYTIIGSRTFQLLIESR